MMGVGAPALTEMKETDMSDDFRDRLPDADRIRDRIREQRSDEYTEWDGDKKFDGVTDDDVAEQKLVENEPLANNFEERKVTYADAQEPDSVFKFGEVLDDRTSSLKWENIKESGEADQPDRLDAFMKLPDIEGESVVGGAEVKYGDIEGMVRKVEGVVDHKSDDVVDHKADDVVDHKSDDVVDHQSDDFTERPTLGAETVHLTVADEPPGSEPDGYMKIDEVLGESASAAEPDSILTNNENITEWKADSVASDVEPDSILTQNENISGVLADSNPTPMVGAFDDITGADQPAPSGKEIDPATPNVHDAADMKMELGLDKSSPKMESGVVDASGDVDAIKIEINAVSPETIDPLTDPVGDALAPLESGDELISMPEIDDAVDAASPNFDDDSLDGA